MAQPRAEPLLAPRFVPRKSLPHPEEDEGIDATWPERFFEFARAVVPLAVFIIIYCGLFVGSWFESVKVVGGLTCVIVGLTFFKYGLTHGLMPFAEMIGNRLPRKQSEFGMVCTTGALGTVVTFAEPGIDSLQMVGRYVKNPPDLLQLLLVERPLVLLCAIAAGVGIAAAVGMLRIRRGWQFIIILITVVPCCIMIAISAGTSRLGAIVPLAFDSGCITTGPATVPIVLALGAGLSKSSGNEGASGFGVVTLASLFPILTVLLCGLGTMYSGLHVDKAAAAKMVAEADPGGFLDVVVAQVSLAGHSILPLTLFLIGVQLLIIREKIADPPRFVKGVTFAFLGLSIFNVGLFYGSLKLGNEAGIALPAALREYAGKGGQAVILAFGFVCGLIATFIDLEPCGLGELAHKVTKGQISKMPLFLSISLGVGTGVAVGFARVLNNWDLNYILIPGYIMAISFSLANREETLVCIAWDAAGVTTGPVTVPLVLALGVGIAGATGGSAFGILACSPVFAITGVLILGLIKMPPANYKETLLNKLLTGDKPVIRVRPSQVHIAVPPKA